MLSENTILCRKNLTIFSLLSHGTVASVVGPELKSEVIAAPGEVLFERAHIAGSQSDPDEHLYSLMLELHKLSHLKSSRGVHDRKILNWKSSI